MRFVLVDRLLEWRRDEYARGIKAVTGSEDFFIDHFPGNPVLPGVLILEALAQTGGALFGLSSDYERFAMMTFIDDARFRTPVRPGDMLELEVTVEALDRGTARVSARASVGGRTVATARIAYILLPLGSVMQEPYAAFWRDRVRALTAGDGPRADSSAGAP